MPKTVRKKFYKKKHNKSKKHCKSKKYCKTKKRCKSKKYCKTNKSKKRCKNTFRRFQKGGLFNPDETRILKERLIQIGFVEDADDHIEDLSKISQKFTGPYFDQLMEQINAIHTPEEFIVWKDDVIADFEHYVDTDVETNSDVETETTLEFEPFIESDTD
jgi:hypothetical protein